MKRIICFFAAILLITPSFCIAESIDYSSMPTDSLIKTIESIQNELQIRLAKDQEKVFLLEDPNGLTIYLSGKITPRVGDSISLECIAINNGKKAKSFYYYTVAVNGWVIEKWKTIADELAPGKKVKDTITFYDEEFIDSWNDPIILEFDLFDGNSAFKKGDLIGHYKIIYYNGLISLVE